MTSPQQRHRALAGITRWRLLAILRQSKRPMSIHELAGAVDLHRNTVREHLEQLVDVGLVTRETASPAGRLSPAQGAIVEFTTAEDGLYPMVTHAFNLVGRGAPGLFQAGDGDPLN